MVLSLSVRVNKRLLLARTFTRRIYPVGHRILFPFQDIRDIKILANLSAKSLFDIWMSWNRGHFARTYVLIQRVPATFPYQMAVILLKILDEFVAFHYRVKESV